jgi:hypothetical protein
VSKSKYLEETKQEVIHMPGNDGTGPTGQGPMTGRGMGFCILVTDSEKTEDVTGLAGIDGKPVEFTNCKTSALALRASAYAKAMADKTEDKMADNKKEVITMPGGDGTGPGGMGPMTGRAVGYCAGYPMPGFTNPIQGRGFGFGRGRGFGRGLGRGFRGGRGWAGYGAAAYGMPYGYGALPMPYGATTGVPYGVAPTSQQELDALKGQSEYLEDALGGIRKRIGEIETEAKKK